MIWGVIGVAIAVNFVIPARRREALRAYCRELEKTGFKTTQRIVTADFLPKTWVDPFTGIWVDYESKLLAIRTSHDEVIPKIYGFKEIIGYEVVAGPRRIYTSASTSGGGIGIGAISVINARTEIVSHEGTRDTVVRIALEGGDSGARVIHLPLWRTTTAMRILRGNELRGAATRTYELAIECGRYIADELSNILRINNS